MSLDVNIEYFETLKFDRFPTAILTICLLILSGISFSIGLIMNAIGKVIPENRKLKYNSSKSNYNIFIKFNLFSSHTYCTFLFYNKVGISYNI